MKQLKVTLKKSTIGSNQSMKDTVRSLGLKKINSSAVHVDNPSIRGMIFKVKHLAAAEKPPQEAIKGNGPAAAAAYALDLRAARCH